MNTATRPTIVPLRIPQVPHPHYPTQPRSIAPGGALLSGKLAAAIDKYKLDTRDMPPSRFKSVRDDISKYAPVPVTRVALRQAPHAYVGIIDSNDTPYMFALNSKGILLRKAPDFEKAWQLFDQYMDAERAHALESRRRIAAREQATLVVKAIKTGAGSRGGHYYFDRKGKVRYGTPTQPKAKHAQVTDHDVHVHLPNAEHLEGPTAKLHRFLRKQKPTTVHETRKHMRGWLKDNIDVHHKHLDKLTSEMLDFLHGDGALHLKEKDQTQAAKRSGGETFFKKRQAIVKPILPTAFDTRGTQLVINGKATRVSADAEHACYAFAKRFLVNDGKVKGHAEFVRGFEKSLHAMGVAKGEYDYRHFVKRITSEPEVEKEAKSKEAPTPATHPHMFIKQDGEHIRLADVRTPAGNFYTGKGKRGVWARALREEDLTMNVSNGAAPKGWKGKVINDPSKDYYLTWRHPDTDELGYVYPSRANTYQKKFEEASKLGLNIDRIRDGVVSDISNEKYPMSRRIAALCTYLIDKEHFRVGEETNAEEHGTFGIGSLRAEHVKIDGKHVIFDFTGKKDEPWKRVVDFSKMPEALALVKSCLKKKHKSERLWEGDNWSVDSKDINQYLDVFSKDGTKFTAKMFRTFHANKYARTMIDKLDAAAKALALTPEEVKKIYKGFNVKDKAGKKLLNRNVGGQTLHSLLGLEENHGAKGKGKTIIGILPTIATRLGHTVSSCRNSYIDPVLVVPFGVKHGWDERTISEKKQRDDLPAYQKPAKPTKAKKEVPSRMPVSKPPNVESVPVGGEAWAKERRRQNQSDAQKRRHADKKRTVSDADFAKIVQNAADIAPASHMFGDRKVFVHRVYEGAKKHLGKMTLDEFKNRLRTAARGNIRVSRADLVGAMDANDVTQSHTHWDKDTHSRHDMDGGPNFNFVLRSDGKERR